MEPAILCQHLAKDFRHTQKEPGLKGSLKSFFVRHYERKSAVSDFNLRIEPGEIVGLLGPNGAGKTTLMKMFTGIIVPSAGSLKVFGHAPHQREVAFRRKIALVMGQKSQLWWDIPAMDSFLLLQKYYEIPETDFRKRLGELADLMDVERLLKVHVRKLSLGERMKMELMASLLHQPEIVFLDEPTIGLDLVAQKNIRDFILAWQRENRTTVILTSHYMADVDALCQRIVLVLAGGKRFDGPIREFESVLGRQKFVSVDFEAPVDRDLPLWQGLDASWNAEATRVELRIPEEALRQKSIEILQALPVTALSMEKLPIERVMNELLNNPQLLATESAAD
jgi:ABC-2 type transport system ATP-binding protein